MMRFPRAVLALTILVLGSVSVETSAQSLDVLHRIETRLLDQRLADYDRAYEREQIATTVLRQATADLHSSLGDRTVAVERLRQMEAGLSLANEAALLRAQETAVVRREVYALMDRLAEVDKAIAEDIGALSGTWTLDFGEESGRGTAKLESRGTEVTGSYELASGRRGTFRGRLSGGIVELEQIDSERGPDRRLTGQLSADGTTIRGSWQTFELARGASTQGGWIARRQGR